jgi:hypothetical protein
VEVAAVQPAQIIVPATTNMDKAKRCAKTRFIMITVSSKI